MSPRPGAVRLGALALIAEGMTAADVRADAEPGDAILAQVADVMDELAATGTDAAAALAEIGRMQEAVL